MGRGAPAAARNRGGHGEVLSEAEGRGHGLGRDSMKSWRVLGRSARGMDWVAGQCKFLFFSFLFFSFLPCSVLARLDYAIVHYVIDDGAISVDCRQHHTLGCPPRVGRACRVCCIRLVWRDDGNGIKYAGQPAQCPLLLEPGGQDPFTLGVGLDLKSSRLTGCASLSLAVGLLEQLDLLVGVDVEAAGREARDERTGQRVVCDGRVRVKAQGSPVVLVLEIVHDLAGERNLIGKVRRGSVLRRRR